MKLVLHRMLFENQLSYETLMKTFIDRTRGTSELIFFLNTITHRKITSKIKYLYFPVPLSMKTLQIDFVMYRYIQLINFII